MPGDARYDGVVMVGGVVWRISDALYESPTTGVTDPIVEVRSWIEPVFGPMVSLVSTPTYEPDEVVGSRGGYT
jgi:hypothetical protein